MRNSVGKVGHLTSTPPSLPWKFSSAGPESIQEKQQIIIFSINLVIDQIKLFEKLFLRFITDNIHYFWHLAITYFILTHWFWVPKLKKSLRNFENWNRYFFKKLRGLSENLVSYKKECTWDYPYPPRQVAENVFPSHGIFFSVPISSWCPERNSCMGRLYL